MSDNDLNPLAAPTRWNAESIADRVFRRDHLYPPEVLHLELSNSLALAVEHDYGHLVVRAEVDGRYHCPPVAELVIEFTYNGRVRRVVITRENLSLLHDEIFEALAAHDEHLFEIGVCKRAMEDHQGAAKEWREARDKFLKDICSQWDVLHPLELEIETSEESDAE